MAVCLTDLAAEGFRPGRSDSRRHGRRRGRHGRGAVMASRILAGSAHFVIGEPTGLKVFRAEKGVLWVKVVARGRTAHGRCQCLASMRSLMFHGRLTL